MQKWEYCSLGPFKGLNVGHYPGLYFYSLGKKEDLTRGENEPEGLAKTIRELGLNGWELVGCGSVPRGDRSQHLLYFKRPIEE